MGHLFSKKPQLVTVTVSPKEVAQAIRSAQKTVVLTGAGVSVESGIPTFRDPSDGIWNNHNMAVCSTSLGFKLKPLSLWTLLVDMLEAVDPRPNAAHSVIAQLEAKGLIQMVVTQNVDNLHQDAGSKEVVELHGTLLETRCMKCAKVAPLNRESAIGQVRDGHTPRCICGGVLKPNVVLFGDSLPPKAFAAANSACKRCDLLLVIGTSASVSPANELPKTAKAHGALVIEINPSETELTHHYSDQILKIKATRLTDVMDELQALSGEA